MTATLAPAPSCFFLAGLSPLEQLQLAPIVQRLEAGGALVPDAPANRLEVIGILHSYGEVLDAYSRNLIFIADHQFLELFPAFKYFNGEITLGKWLRYLWHDRINYEFAEYCMKAMLWHGGGGLDRYLDTPEFVQRAKAAIRAKIRFNPFLQGLGILFPDFALEQVRMLAMYSGLGQFWRVMSDIFLALAKRSETEPHLTIPDVVAHIQQGLVAAADKPITYAPCIWGRRYEIIPLSAGLTFLSDTAIPYVEAVFFRSFPFMGTVSYNAQAHQIPAEQADFAYGALYADPLPVGSAGIPPTLLMQDMMRHLPPYLREHYRRQPRGDDDLRVKICLSFQKAMFCVTTAALRALAPFPLETQDPQQQLANLKFLAPWLQRLLGSRLLKVQEERVEA